MATTSPPASRATHVTMVATYNTFTLVEGDVYVLRTPYAGPYFYNIFNLGAGTLYIRADADPVPGDEQTETLPAFCADNLILVPQGMEGLRVLADAPYADDGLAATGTVITLRLVRG